MDQRVVENAHHCFAVLVSLNLERKATSALPPQVLARMSMSVRPLNWASRYMAPSSFPTGSQPSPMENHQLCLMCSNNNSNKQSFATWLYG